MSHRGTRASPGAFRHKRRNLRQLFLHPRAANEEPTKLLRQIFDSPPCHRAVAPPAGPNDEADLWARDALSQKSVPTTLKRLRGQRENEGFIMFR